MKRTRVVEYENMPVRYNPAVCPTCMNADYWRGFHDGKRAGEKEAREKAAQVLAFYIETLREVPGIGEKTYQKIVQHINTVTVSITKTITKRGENS